MFAAGTVVPVTNMARIYTRTRLSSSGQTTLPHTKNVKHWPKHSVDSLLSIAKFELVSAEPCGAIYMTHFEYIYM